MFSLRVIKSSKLLQAFLLTDRGDFVHQTQRNEAYVDRPYKSSFIHQSAPHMYSTVLDNLDLECGQTFLNIGSGTGYLSCLGIEY